MDTNGLPKQTLQYKPKVATTCTENGNKQNNKTGAQNIVKEIKQYQKNWLQHVQRMDTNRIPKQEHRT